MVHEVDDDYSPGMELDQVNFPHLWRYRTRVTLDHLTRTFTEQQKQTTGDKEDTVNYPVLSYFLENVRWRLCSIYTKCITQTFLNFERHKPIFQKPRSRWLPNANEIDTNNMKST